MKCTSEGDFYLLFLTDEVEQDIHRTGDNSANAGQNEATFLSITRR